MASLELDTCILAFLVLSDKADKGGERDRSLEEGRDSLVDNSLDKAVVDRVDRVWEEWEARAVDIGKWDSSRPVESFQDWRIEQI